MTAEHIEFLVEEPSVEAALLPLLPKIVGLRTTAVHVHQGKSDLLAKLPTKLRGYSAWLPASWRIVVLVDRDQDQCEQLKAKLETIAQAGGLRTRTIGKPYVVATRLVIEELEAWYFGDWSAVRAAYPKVSATVPAQERFRRPDEIKGGTWEAFEQVLQEKGYFVGGLQKIKAAREVGAHLDPARNSSPSFRMFRDVLLEMVT